MMILKIQEYKREYKESGFSPKLKSYYEWVIKLDNFIIISFNSLSSDYEQVEKYCSELSEVLECKFIKISMKKKVVETWEEERNE